jgi:exodeoxyribonuclease VII small subunit
MTPLEPAAGDQPETFETLSAQLAELVGRLESGSLGLSESIAAYERGVGIVRRLQEELAHAEERVSVLVAIDDDGRPVLQPRDAGVQTAHSPQPGGTGASSRGPRSRAPRGKSLPGMDEDGAES